MFRLTNIKQKATRLTVCNILLSLSPFFVRHSPPPFHPPFPPSIMSTLLQKLWSSPTVADVMQNWQDRPIFKGKGDDAPAWLARFEAGCEERKLSENHWVEAADFCMEENPKLRLMEVQKTMTELVAIPGFKWDWRTYRHAVLNIPCKCLVLFRHSQPLSNYVSGNMPRSMKLNLQFLQQFKDMFKKFDKPNPPPQPEPHTITKDDPSMAQYALSFVPGFGFWLPDLLNSDPSPPVEPATPTKAGKGKEKKDKNKDATTGSTKKKEASKPSVSPKDPGKRQEATKSPEAPKDPGAGSLSRFRTLIPYNKAKGTPTEIREAALTVLWAKCSSPEARKKAGT